MSAARKTTIDTLGQPSPLRVTMEMVTRFENRLRGVVDYGSFAFDCQQRLRQYQVGVASSHSARYQLKLEDGRGLGQVLLTRDRPFRESELQLLETCLSDLCIQLQRLIPQVAKPGMARLLT
ncbi:MAG: hypothetical protein ABJ308_12415 [Halieaceae bacterium]